MAVVIRGATIIDGTGRDPRTGTVVIEADRITSVGNDSPHHADNQTIEANGLTLMPGLIDSHVHLTFDATDIVQNLMTPPSLRLYRAAANAKATVEAGVTTVRDAGGAPAGLKLAIAEGLFAGPRMKVSITALGQTGGHTDSTMPSMCCLRVDFPDIPPSVVDGVEPMRQRVREILRAGADWIKVCSTGGVLSSADSPSSSQFTVEELAAAVDEGRAHGDVEVMAHAQGTRGIKNAIRAGVKSIEHGIWLDDEAIAMMKANDVYLVPTLVAPLQVVRRAEAKPGSIPDLYVRKAREVTADHQASFSRAVDAGVKIAMGTDSGVGPHGENAEELERMVMGGMTPMQAIVATTASAAKLLKVDKDLGTIATGKSADLILVEGDPLADIAILKDRQRVSIVIQGGRFVKNLLGDRVPAPLS
ncbi:MAG: amidohydrolase family protein [Fimbriimonadales bacterium]